MAFLDTGSGLTVTFAHRGCLWGFALTLPVKTLEKLAIALKAEPYQFFLTEAKWNNDGSEIFALYLDDFSDTFIRVVREYRHRYHAESHSEQERSKNGKKEQTKKQK